MRNFFGNIGDQSFEAMRLTGVGWIFAFFVVGATILAGRWLVGWQMRKPENMDTPGSGRSDGGTGETPRG